MESHTVLNFSRPLIERIQSEFPMQPIQILMTRQPSDFEINFAVDRCLSLISVDGGTSILERARRLPDWARTFFWSNLRTPDIQEFHAADAPQIMNFDHSGEIYDFDPFAPLAAFLPARILWSDDPWFYNNRHLIRRDNPNKKAKAGMGAQGNYNMGTMKTKHLELLTPYIRPVLAPDCYHFMWATAPRLPDAFRLMSQRGFVYKTFAQIWLKFYPGGKQFCGMGSYIPSNSEFVCIGVNEKKPLWHSNKGKKPLQGYPTANCAVCDNMIQNLSTNPSTMHQQAEKMAADPDFHFCSESCAQYAAEFSDEQIKFGQHWGRGSDIFPLVHPRNPEKSNKIIHSKKPEEFQDRIDSWLDRYLDGYSKLEIFATRQRAGWECIGGELSGRDIRDDLIELKGRMN